MQSAKKNVAVLAACQALLFTNLTITFAVNGLAGYALAPDKALATLPVTAGVIGGALSTLPASLLMKRIGRRAGFTLGVLIGMAGAALCALALVLGSFALLCLGTVVLGVYNAIAQYYRFAAADSVASDFKAKAISLVLAGGLVGGIIGPEAGKLTVGLFQTQYLGAYLALIGFLVPCLFVVQLLEIPSASRAESVEPVRPLARIMGQPVFIVAASGAAIGYAVMMLLMSATPLAMTLCGHPFSAAATVIGWHVIGMFGPSFFTGSLIKRYGAINVMSAGVVLLLVCIAIALSGISVPHFWLAMMILGVGWNFLFIGGTTLLTDACTPGERAKTQGANDLIIFIVMAISSFSSGFVLDKGGWQVVNYLALPLVALVGASLVWFALRSRRGVLAA